MGQTLERSQVYKLDFEDEEGNAIIGRVIGWEIAESDDVRVFLTEDERVLLYDEGRSNYWTLKDPKEDLRDWLDDEEYLRALTRMGNDRRAEVSRA